MTRAHELRGATTFVDHRGVEWQVHRGDQGEGIAADILPSGRLVRRMPTGLAFVSNRGGCRIAIMPVADIPSSETLSGMSREELWDYFERADQMYWGEDGGWGLHDPPALELLR